MKTLKLEGGISKDLAHQGDNMKDTNANISKTDERFIADFVLPGLDASAVSVTVRPERWTDYDGKTKGHDFTVKVRGTVADGFGANKLLRTDLKETVAIPMEFDPKTVAWNYKSGVLRVYALREAFSVGTVVQASEVDYVSPSDTPATVE